MTAPKDRWKHRRRFAYASLVGGLVFPFLFLAQPALKDIAIPFYGFLTFVMTAFIGGAVYDDKWQKNGQQAEN